MMGAGSGDNSVFLGGPIQYAFTERGFDRNLRQLITSLHGVLRDAGLTVFSAHFAEGFGELDMSDAAGYVTRRDYEWTRACGTYVCVLPSTGPGRPYRSDGTCLELGWASALGKRIVIIWDPAVQYSHLITGLAAVAAVTYLPIDEVLAAPAMLLPALSTPRRALAS